MSADETASDVDEPSESEVRSSDVTKKLSKEVVDDIYKEVFKNRKIISYQAFFKQRKDSPITTRPSFVIEAASIWTSLPRVDKDRFHELAGVKKEFAESKRKKYKLRERSLWKLINQEEKEMYYSMDAEGRANHAKVAASIKGPRNSYTVFLMEAQFALKEGSKQWAEMSEGQKNKFRIMSVRDRLRFMEESLELIPGPTSAYVRERVRKQLSASASKFVANQFDNVLSKSVP